MTGVDVDKYFKEEHEIQLLSNDNSDEEQVKDGGEGGSDDEGEEDNDNGSDGDDDDDDEEDDDDDDVHVLQSLGDLRTSYLVRPVGRAEDGMQVILSRKRIVWKRIMTMEMTMRTINSRGAGNSEAPLKRKRAPQEDEEDSGDEG
ncbi:hypothetical protein ISN44_As13g005410 [Arabidopsis suecica]|uniref:Uncharacterized protein n=1 Tax=Arabidopsis suecica TaxID=45249 RepID=A0A8T1XZS1_ARASU|nr:hypothetical protein ISN44_As13g005410 [Arabidopsis suecica]